MKYNMQNHKAIHLLTAIAIATFTEAKYNNKRLIKYLCRIQKLLIRFFENIAVADITCL